MFAITIYLGKKSHHAQTCLSDFSANFELQYTLLASTQTSSFSSQDSFFLRVTVDDFIWPGSRKLIWNRLVGRLRCIFKKGWKSLPVKETQLLRRAGRTVVAPTIYSRSAGAVADKERLNRLARKGSSVLGCPLEPVEEEIPDGKPRLGSWLLRPRCVKERYRSSFLPAAVRLDNQSCSQKTTLYT